jgi:hypothetical protein
VTTNEITNVFDDLWECYIVNVNLLVQDGDKILVYSYWPFSPGRCGKARRTLSNTFENGTFRNRTSFFPNKLTDFRNCSLRVATNSVPPYIITNEDSKKIALNEIDGIDAHILKAMSGLLKFQFILFFVKDNNQWGQIFPNGSATGATGMVSLT